jgi:hypothetical protein
MPSKLADKIDNMGRKIASMLPSTSGGFLTNKWFLYIVLFSALFDLFYFYQKEDVYAITIFFIIGFLVSFFSKNMVVILIIAIAMTHLIRYGKNLSEGFEGEEEEKEDEEAFAGEASDEEEKEDEEAFAGEEEEKEDEEAFESEASEEKEKETKKDKRNTKNDKLTTTTVGFRSSNMDEQTHNLILAQNKLMENMKTLEPLLTKAETFLSEKKEKFTNYADAYKK